MDVIAAARRAISERGLAAPDTAVLLMVSGGSDSTALAYVAAELRDAGELGPLAMLHVNHWLRGADADADGRIFVAHTEDDRVESFYMRSIVGTGPGGFRSMRYLNGRVARPLLDCGRQELRDYVIGRVGRGLPVARDREEMPWREDATNEHGASKLLTRIIL